MSKISSVCLLFVALASLVYPGTVLAQADTANEIRNPSVATIYGVPLEGGGCSYSGTIAMSPEGKSVSQKPVYQDSASCMMLVEQGEPVLKNIRGGSQTPTRGKSEEASSKNKVTASLTYATVRNSRAYLHTWLEDPLHADVNSVTSYINWWWNGSSVVGTFTCSNHRWWLSPTGWRQDNSNLRCYYVGGRAVSSTYAHFTNPYFCATIDTHAVYDRNNIRGSGNGWWYADWNVRWDGGCWWLLHFHWEAGYL